MIAEARGDDNYEILLTNRTGEGGLTQRLASFVASERKEHPHLTVRFREDAAPSLRVDLGAGAAS